jgi:hypothetical protein
VIRIHAARARHADRHLPAARVGAVTGVLCDDRDGSIPSLTRHMTARRTRCDVRAQAGNACTTSRQRSVDSRPTAPGPIAVTGPDDRPVPARQVTPRRSRNPPPSPQDRRVLRSRGHRETFTSLTRRLTLPEPRPRGTAPPPRPAPCGRKPGCGPRSPQNPHTTCGAQATPAPQRYHRDHAFCWSEARLASSRDRTRTYNLPVNRRSVVAGTTRAFTDVSRSLPA